MKKIKSILKIALGWIGSLLSGVEFHKGIYMGVGVKISGGQNVYIGEYAEIMPYSMIVPLGGKIEIGKGSTVSMFSRIAATGYVRIGDYVERRPNCFIADFNHEYRDINVPIKRQGKHFVRQNDGSPNVQIGDGSWLGTHVVIAGNIKIRKHSVIGANSVVTRDIPDYCIAVGSPARIIKKYNFDRKERI